MNDKGTTWESELRGIVQKNWKVDDVFTIEGIYRYEDHFSGLYPENHFVRKKLQEIMQKLRDDGLVEFVDYDGTYRRIK
jgi:hypothetical protein